MTVWEANTWADVGVILPVIRISFVLSNMLRRFVPSNQPRRRVQTNQLDRRVKGEF